MTYREQMHALSTAMRSLLEGAGPVTGADLDSALAAQTALVQLLRTVHSDVTGMVRPSVKPDIRGLEQTPIALLSRMLRDHPDTPGPPISDLVADSATSPAGELWRQVGRHATVATYDWQTALPASRPTGDARWTELADLAALSEGLAVLSGDLAGSLTAAGRVVAADRFRQAATSGLASTASAVRRLAQAGPTPAPAHLGPAPSRRVIVVRAAEHLPLAVHRLGHLVRSAVDLSPEHVQLIARALGTAALASSRGLASPGPAFAEASQTMRTHAERLAAITGSPRRAASIAPSDPAALAQARQIHDWLTVGGRAGGHRTVPDPSALAHALVDASLALDVAVEQQIASRRWLTPRDGTKPDLLDWQPMAEAAVRPELARAVRSAGEHATVVGRALPTALPRSTPPSPRATLASALASRDTPSRPRLSVIVTASAPRRR